MSELSVIVRNCHNRILAELSDCILVFHWFLTVIVNNGGSGTGIIDIIDVLSHLILVSYWFLTVFDRV